VLTESGREPGGSEVTASPLLESADQEPPGRHSSIQGTVGADAPSRGRSILRLEPVVGLAVGRRLLACALLLAWVVLTWISYQTPYLQVCEDQVARIGTEPLVRSCGPLSLTAAPLLVLLVAAGLLLLPDLSAIEFAGIVRLERRVEEQAKRQDDVIRMIQQLEVTQQQKMSFTLVEGENAAARRAAEVAKLIVGLNEKNEQFDDIDSA
jgi:hypothetical protein